MSEAYRLGPFTLDATTGVLARDGTPAALGKRAVAVLTALVRSPRAFVPKARILEAAWPGLVVQESNLAVQVLSIRRALAQAEGGDAWLETLPKRGYRYVGPVVRLDDAPAPIAAGPPPTRLPEPLTSFVGREREQADVAALLPQHRLVTLIGAGGVGKTRLALRVASAAAAGYPDGVWLVELASLADPGLVPQAAGAALGLKEQPNRLPVEALVESLRPKRLLIVLDNAEHLLAACTALVDSVLRRCPQVAWLVTSRERLAVPGEQCYVVPALSLPDAGADATPERLAHADSVRLLCERARLNVPGFAITTGNAASLASICRRLDGLPLAIELAAARLRTLAPQELEHRLDRRFAMLVGGGPTLPARQQTLRAAIDWSHDLLGDDERKLLGRLSVFAGGFTLDAAERVCAGDGIAAERMLDTLASLADKSLVVVGERAGATRYRLLESIRDYAGEKLDERGEASRVRARHRDAFLALAQEAEPQITGKDQLAWLERLEADHDNLRAALERSLEPGDAQPALRLATAIARFWLVRGHLAEGRAWLARILALPGGEGTATRGKSQNWAGVFAWKQGDYAAAREHYEAALAIRRALGDRGGVGAVLSNLGLLAYEQGDYASALSLHEQSLAVDRELGDRWGVAVSLIHLGGLAARHGDATAARAHYEESLAIFRELGDRAHVANSLRSLGALSVRQGDAAGARALYEASLAICRELGDRSGIAWALDGLGAACRHEGDLASAGRLHDEALSMFRELGDREGIAGTLLNLGRVAAGSGDPATARELNCESLDLFHALGDRSGIAASLEGLATIAAASGSPGRAARLHGAAACLRETIASPIDASERSAYERDLAGARAALGDDAFDRAWQEGRTMGPDEAIAIALADHDH
jgi:non-specific serine/threonine protein kinase